MSDYEHGASAEGLAPSAPNGNGSSSEVRPSSLLAHLRQERDERAAQRTLELAIPGWQGDDGYGLVVVLRALSFSEAQPLNRRFATMMLQGERADDQQQRKDAAEELALYADGLVRACVDIRVRTPDGGTLALDETPMAGPCRFDPHTCALLSLPRPQTAREAVLLVYRRNEWALQEAWAELQTFTRDAKNEETEQLLGETRP